MKKIILFLLLFFIFPTKSLAESIDSFYTNIEINRDGTFNVTETISYDFENLEKHGIFRDIPQRVAVEDQFKILQITPQSVLKDSFKEPYQKLFKDDYLSIKIGSPDKTITNKHTYVISYNVKNGLSNFIDHDELYWNATGNQWKIPIAKAITTITPPQNIPITKTKCFTGASGGTAQNCIISQDQTIFTTQYLTPFEGLTIVAAFPPNTFPKSMLTDHSSGSLSKLQWEIIIIFFAIIQIILNIFLPIILFRKFQRKNNLGPVTVNFDIPTVSGQRLAPALAGTTDTAQVEKNDLIATIFDLAIRKHIKITQNIEKVNYLLFNKDETRYYFEKLQGESQDRLEPHEQILFDRLFQDSQIIDLASLNSDFYLTYQTFEQSVYNQLVNRNLYTGNPKNRRILFISLAAFSFFFGAIILAITFLILAGKNTNRTESGDEVDWRIDGLKLFLQKMERNYEWQANQLAAVEQMIPYAMAFGYIEKFMDQLKIIMPDYHPDWYTGNASFYLVANSMMTSMNSSFSTNAPSSSSGFSGGGSSGGGGGGGGGGSW